MSDCQMIRVRCHHLHFLWHQHLGAAVGLITDTQCLSMGASQVVTVTRCICILSSDGLNGKQPTQASKCSLHQAEQQTLSPVGVAGEHIKVFEPVASTKPGPTHFHEVGQNLPISEDLGSGCVCLIAETQYPVRVSIRSISSVSASVLGKSTQG